VVVHIFGTTPGSKYGYKIGDVLVTDFITPNWYPPEHAGKTIDFKNHASAAFAVLPGGYAMRIAAGCRSLAIWRRTPSARARPRGRGANAAPGWARVCGAARSSAAERLPDGRP
jgi:hypothetical protein